jgi:hypothetical protein
MKRSQAITALWSAWRSSACVVIEELPDAHEDGSASWLYTRALVAFRESGDSDEQAAALVRDAWSANEHVPAILAGTKPPVISDDGYVSRSPREPYRRSVGA